MLGFTRVSFSYIRVQNICFFSPLVLSKSEVPQLSQFVYFWGKCGFFSILNDKMHNYVKHNLTVNFIIQKLKNKHIFLKKYINWESWGTSWRENLAFSVCIHFKNLRIFQFLTDTMHNYVKQNIFMHFIIQKLKNKHSFLKNIQTEKAKEPLILTEQEETKNRYFPLRLG